MSKITRNPAGFSKNTYDVIIIGGGIYGVMLAFEASKRGLKSLLLEKADFGGATTFNTLRIIHGGFRYLQHLDLNHGTVGQFANGYGVRKFNSSNEPGRWCVGKARAILGQGNRASLESERFR